MTSLLQFKTLALAFPEALEQAHFENLSFRINKKIFATLDEKAGRACLKLSKSDQDLFALVDKTIIYPVPNKWGQQGWTFVELSLATEEMVQEALVAAYCAVAPKRLAAQFHTK